MLRGKKQQLLDTKDSLDDVQQGSATSTLTEVEIPDHLPDLRLIHTVRWVVEVALDGKLSAEGHWRPQGESTCCRDLTDPVYAILTRAIFSSIERIAATDSKHGDRLRLENYVMYETLMRNFAPQNPVLAYFVAAAASSKDNATTVSLTLPFVPAAQKPKVQNECAVVGAGVRATSAAVRKTVAAGGVHSGKPEKKAASFMNAAIAAGAFPQLRSRVQGIEPLLQEVGPEELLFQPGHRPGDLRDLLSATVQRCEHRLSRLHARVTKHLCANTALIRMVSFLSSAKRALHRIFCAVPANRQRVRRSGGRSGRSWRAATPGLQSRLPLSIPRCSCR